MMEDNNSTLLVTNMEQTQDTHDVNDYPKKSEQLLDSTSDNCEDNTACFCSFVPKRYLVTFLAMFGFFNAYALRVNLSVAVVAMVNNITYFSHGHSVENMEAAEFSWNTKVQGVVLGSFFFGYIITQIPGGYLATKYGGKVLFGIGVLVPSILTMFTPTAARIHVYLLIALRIFEGIFQGVLYSSNHTVMSHWAPVLERSKMIALSASGSFIGTVVTLPVSGILIKQYGWPSVFYFFGLLGMFWSLLWFVMVSDTPSEHPKISKSELKYIESSLNGESTNDKERYDRAERAITTDSCARCRNVPWKSIFTSGPVWAIVAAHFCQNWSYYILLTTLPTYLKDVLHINLLATGFLSSLPYIVMTFALHITGLVSDLLRTKQLCTTTCVRKFCVGTGFFLQAVFLVIVGYATTEASAVILLSLAVGTGGLLWCGFGVNHIDIAPRYAGLLMGITNCFATIPGIVGPPIAGALTTNETITEWRIVFYISAGVSLLGLVVFCFLGSGEKQSWNDNEYIAVPTSPVNSPK